MPKYANPAVTVDIVVFSVFNDDLQVLLIERGHPPFKGQWAFPGGFIEIDEPLETAARRELEEETGLRVARMEQLHTFGDPGRDPRGRTISVVYLTLVNVDQVQPQAADDAAAVNWFSVFNPPPLAFDHDQILRCAVERLQQKLEVTVVGRDWLPRRFTLVQLQRIYEIILHRPLDRRAFRRRIMAQNELVEVGLERTARSRRAAKLYSFRSSRSMNRSK